LIATKLNLNYEVHFAFSARYSFMAHGDVRSEAFLLALHRVILE